MKGPWFFKLVDLNVNIQFLVTMFGLGGTFGGHIGRIVDAHVFIRAKLIWGGSLQYLRFNCQSEQKN